MPCFKINFYKHFLPFEQLHTLPKKHTLISGAQFTEVSDCIKNYAQESFKAFNSKTLFSPIFSRSDINLLRNLGKNQAIIITRPDKGRGVILLDRDKYKEKMQTILSDNTKFQEVQYSSQFDNTQKTEDKINRHIRKLLNNGSNKYDSLHAPVLALG